MFIFRRDPTIQVIVRMMMSDRARSIWRMQLGSAFRTALACSMVGSATLFGPESLRKQLAFPAFSYVTAILIVSDATLGDALKDCWHTLFATCQVVPLSILILRLVGPVNFSPSVAAILVAIGSFLVALPECTNIMCKRIAFGQMVIVGVGSVVYKEHVGVVMHPVRVALSTGLGAFASVLAMLLPYPRLANSEVRKLCRSYAENASKRNSLFIEAFSAREKGMALDAISRAKPLAEKAAKLLQRIKITQEGVLWRKPRIRGLKFLDRLQEMESAIKGMEIVLSHFPLIPTNHTNEELKKNFLEIELQIGRKLKQVKSFACDYNAATTPEWNTTPIKNILTSFRSMKLNDENLAALFFLSCIKLLQDDSSVTQYRRYAIDESSTEKTKDIFKRVCAYWTHWCFRPNNERLTFALKCSLSLCFAVLFGLFFSIQNGFWSGLTIAISFATNRQATFTLANARAQGTAIGSVYGVLGCYFIRNSIKLRVLTLLPWIIFTSFLQHSRMYGQAGGISAAIAALLILGRKSYGLPAEFAITRLTEAFIGLFCLITVELLLQPIRAATLSKTQLSKSLRTLRECINELYLSSNKKDMPIMVHKMVRKQDELKECVEALEEMIREADLEPNFWFLPFRAEFFNTLISPISKTGDFLFFMSYELGSLVGASEELGLDWKVLRDRINENLETFKQIVDSELDYLEKVVVMKSSVLASEKHNQSKKINNDLEKGISPDTCKIKMHEEGPKKATTSLLKCIQGMIDDIWNLEGEDEKKSEVVLYLGAFGFCIKNFMKETEEIKKGVIDLVQWDDPLSH